MSFGIAFLLTLLVFLSQGDASALKDYFLKGNRRAASRIRLTGEYENGFVLKNSPGEKPYSATFQVLLGNNDGIVFVYHVFKINTSRKSTTCKKDRDILKVDLKYVYLDYSRTCSHYVMEKHAGYPGGGDKATISYTRRENSNSRFELTLTAFTDPPCGEKFECGDQICVSAELRCDGRTNCRDGSDERGCNGTCADGSIYPSCHFPDYCGDVFDDSGCNATDISRDGSDGEEGTDAAGYKPSSGFYIFLYVALSIVLVVCLAYIGIRRQEIFKKCCKRGTDTESA